MNAAKAARSFVEKVADNTFLLVLSRLAMLATPLMLTGLVTLGGLYLGSASDRSREIIADLNRQLQAVQAQADKALAAATEINKQMAVTNQIVGANGVNSLAWQVSTSGRLDKMTDTLSVLSSAVAALDATVRQINR